MAMPGAGPGASPTARALENDMNTENTQGNGDLVMADLDALSRWLSTAELLETSGLSNPQLRRLQSKGIVKATKKAGSDLWHVSNIDRVSRFLALKSELRALLGPSTDAEAPNADAAQPDAPKARHKGSKTAQNAEQHAGDVPSTGDAK